MRVALLAAVVGMWPRISHSQTAMGGAGTGATANARIVTATAANIGSLATLPTRTNIDGVSLSVTEADLQANPTAWEGLSTWVRAGGVVFLHTDAAARFRFRTVAARRGTARQAGQLFGRAVAALPFGAHPLLWGATRDGRAANAAQARVEATPNALGVRVVYYQLNPGDHLVQEHPEGVPLLRVTDLAGPAGTTPLYAAAAAPFGDGWAVFAPSLVEQHRADGALFLQNLLRLVDSQSRARRTSDAALTSVAASTLEAGADALKSPNQQTYTRLAALLTQTTGTTARRGAQLMLTRRELRLTAALLRLADADATARSRATAMLYLLRARLEIQRDALEEAAKWMDAAAAVLPNTAEEGLWRGVLLSDQAEVVAQPTADRATLLRDAAEAWADASTAPSLLTGQAAAQDEEADEEVAAATTAATSVSGLPRSTIMKWAEAAGAAGDVIRFEPPVVIPLGDESSAIIVRCFENDATQRLLLPSADVIARSAGTLGCRADGEQILVFPTPEYYEDYRASIGLGGGATPAGGYGDVAGGRILMMSQPALPIVFAPTVPGGPRRVVQVGTAVPAVVSRLHTYVLTNQLAGGGTPVPDWLQLGLAVLCNLKTVTDVGGGGEGQGSANLDAPVEALGVAAAGNGLLTPEQFQGYASRIDTSGLSEAQAMRLTLFFYERFGAGRVVETLQRLGARQNMDDAMRATTGLDEAGFFLAWSEAEFPQRTGGGRR